MKSKTIARNFIVIATGSSLLAISSASAQSGTWLGNGLAWNAAAGAAWTDGIIADGADNTANFTGVNITGATVSMALGANRIIGNIIFTDDTTSSTNLTLAGNTLTLDVASGAPVIDVTQSGRTLTISSLVSGNDGLTKSGAGTLTLGSNSSYTGATSLNNGTLGLITSSGYGLFPSAITMSASTTLRFAPTANSGSTGAIDLNGTLTYNPSGNVLMLLSGAVTASSASTINISAGGKSSSGLILDGGLKGSADISLTPTSAGVGLVLRAGGSGNYSGTMTVGGTASATAGTGSGLAVGRTVAGGNVTLPNANLIVNGTLELGNSTAGMNWTGVNLPSGQTFQMNALDGTGVVVGNFISGNFTRTISVGNNNGSGNFSGQIVNGTNNTLSFIKAGNGTQTLSGANTYSGATTISGGTMKLGANNVLPNAITSTVSIGSATLDADTRTDTLGTLDVTGTAVINLGAGAALAFADSKAVDWTGGTLNVTGTLGATSLRFGDSADDLTPEQRALISVNGSGLGTYILDADGYLVASGGGDMTPPTLTSITDNAGASPITVGTMVVYTVTFSEDMEASTVTAEDFNNAGTAAVTIGTVTETTPGVFTVQATPTSAGSLTLRIAGPVLQDTSVNNLVVPLSDDTTITVQTHYQAWAGGGAFDADANGDGVLNGLAFLLGATGPGADALGKLPKPTESAGGLTLEFQMLPATARGTASLVLEHSNTLGAWTFVAIPSSSTTVDDVVFVITGTNPLIVTATIPVSKAAAGKLFGRVKGVSP